MNKEELRLRKELQKYADSQNFKLNENENAVESVIKGLLNNKEKHGGLYCPCRVVTGNKKEDKKIICPCVYHKQEIAEIGHCLCSLFWQKQV